MHPVRQIPGELLRFHVLSRSRPSHFYLVDLQEFRLNGQCGCDHFNFRLGPQLKGEYRPHDATRCWHIRQAREWLLNRTLVGLVRIAEGKRDERKKYLLTRDRKFAKVERGRETG